MAAAPHRRFGVSLALFAALLMLAVLRPAPADPLGFEALRQLIEQQHLRSIEEVLPRLPADYRARYVLMFDSRSLHGSSPRDPRVILYGSDARFIVTFNGQPDQRGYRDLEVVEYEPDGPDGAGFAYRQIEFPAPGDAAAPVSYSERNPALCRGCHGTPARPVWDSFPTWPGAYGERYLEKLSPREAAGLAEFLANQHTHPRYRHLEGAQRLARSDAFAPTVQTNYSGVAHEPANAEFSTLLGRLQLATVVEQLRRAPGFAAWRYALLASLDPGCGRAEELVPRRLLASAPGAYEAFVDRARLVDRRQFEAKELRTISRHASAATTVESLDPFRYLVEVGLGLSTASWSLALEKPTYDFALPGGARPELERQLLEVIIREEPAIGPLAAARTVSDSGHYCGELRRRSRLALAAQPAAADDAANLVATPGATARAADITASAATSATTPAGAPPATVQRCIACHSTGVGPALPFDAPARLAALLSRRGYSHGALLDEILFRLSPDAGPHRMPLGINLADEERAALEDWFRALATGTGPRRSG